LEFGIIFVGSGETKTLFLWLKNKDYSIADSCHLYIDKIEHEPNNYKDNKP